MLLGSPIADWCVTSLGAAPVRELFRRSHLSEVIGVELDDGREVVIKIRPPSPRLDAVAAVQRHVHSTGFPCPEVLAGPAPLGSRVATAESYLAPHDAPPAPPPPGPVAELLASLVRSTPAPSAAPRLAGTVPWVGWDHSRPGLWPWPDDLDVDMDRHPGPEWLDRTAARIRDRMRRADGGRLLIGHADWEAQNLDWIGDRPVAVHDWDSLAIRTEPAIAGAAAAVYPCDGTTVMAATVEQTAAFLDAYRAAAGSGGWSADDDEVAWCAGLWVLTYNAKKETLGGGTGYFHRLADELPARAAAAGL